LGTVADLKTLTVISMPLTERPDTGESSTRSKNNPFRSSDRPGIAEDRQIEFQPPVGQFGDDHGNIDVAVEYE